MIIGAGRFGAGTRSDYHEGSIDDVRTYRRALTDAEINRDSNLRLQYLAGMGLNKYENAGIYDEMLRYRRFPENLFVGSDSEKAFLRESMHMDAAAPPPLPPR